MKTEAYGGRQTYAYGNPAAKTVLIQPVDDHDLSVMESEICRIRALTDTEFRLIAVRVDDWNHDLSPWSAPAVFGGEGFGDGAEGLLTEVLRLCSDDTGACIIGGYSLAGLFALWAGYQTDRFAAVAAASPSVWFPGFMDYMRKGGIRARSVYLSLGDREEKTKNAVMSTVGRCIREGYGRLKENGVHCTLEWNPGNHFQEPDLRMAKAFAWAIDSIV